MNSNAVKNVSSLERINILPLVIKRFSVADSMDELCREIVLSTTRTLGFDRCGCFLFDKENHQKLGMWGIDNFGMLADERGMTAPIHHHEILPQNTLESIIVFTDQALYHQEQLLGMGTLVQCTIFDGENLLGWLFIDNFLSKKDFSKSEIEFIALYGSVVGQLMARQQQQELLKTQNKALNKTIQQLQSAQQEIIETKKLSALSRLVCGIAHELNTPLGVTLTAASHVKESADGLLKSLEQDSLTRFELMNHLGEIQEGSKLACNSIVRSVQLIGDFKQLITTSEYEVSQSCSVANLVTERFSTFKEEFPAINMSLSLSQSQMGLNWVLPINAIIKVFDELFRNSIVHGFEGRDQGHIHVDIEKKIESDGDFLYVNYTDDGCGMGDDIGYIFDPFFTRNQQLGTGLGMSIVHNLVNHVLKGKIQVNNLPNGGLSVILKFPTASAG